MPKYVAIYVQIKIHLNIGHFGWLYCLNGSILDIYLVGKNTDFCKHICGIYCWIYLWFLLTLLFKCQYIVDICGIYICADICGDILACQYICLDICKVLIYVDISAGGRHILWICLDICHGQPGLARSSILYMSIYCGYVLIYVDILWIYVDILWIYMCQYMQYIWAKLWLCPIKCQKNTFCKYLWIYAHLCAALNICHL